MVNKNNAYMWFRSNSSRNMSDLKKIKNVARVYHTECEYLYNNFKIIFCRDSKVLEFLYEEAKYNILTGRYPCEISDYIMLGGIQARLELGPYNPDTHTLSFMKAELYRFLPEHAAWSSSWTSCLSPPWRASKNSPEARLIEQFKAIPSNAGHNRLVRKYLQFCWTLPYYGSAFFHGQIGK